MNVESEVCIQSAEATAQERVAGSLDRAGELQHTGKLTEAASELERALAIARATPYEVEFLTRIRLVMALSDIYLALDRTQDASTMLADEAAFADRIRQIIQATGTPAQKRDATSGYLQVRDRATQTALIGQIAPEISVKAWINDGPAALAELRGRVVLLEFWATWCKPCHAMFPKLRQLHEENVERELEIIALTRHYMAYGGTLDSKKEEQQLMSAMVTEHGIAFPVGVAEDEGLQTTYGANGLPTVVLIDRRGVVRYAGPGGDDPAFVRTLETCLSESA